MKEPLQTSSPKQSKKFKPSWSKISPHSEPIYQTSVYDYPNLETLDDYYAGLIPGGYIYSRNGLPNSVRLGNDVAHLEHAEEGVVCSSGMGAITVALLSMLKSGDHIVASSDLYGGTTVLLEQELSKFGVESSFIDATIHSNVKRAIKPAKTKMIIVETISNPTMKVCDIKSISRIARENQAVCLVDNTFATPFVCLPIELGAQIVMHSGTKYLGGHSDLTLGVLCGQRGDMQRAAQFCTRAGVISGPFDCWLARRSIQTWKMRVETSSRNAQRLARFLEQSPKSKISHVYYPGLGSHPNHNLAKKEFIGGNYGGMLSFDLKGGLASASKFTKALSFVTLTPSLGGVRTTISHPTKTSHRHLSEGQRRASGITDAMIRVSVGIEDYDLIEKEFSSALSSVA